MVSGAPDVDRLTTTPGPAVPMATVPKRSVATNTPQELPNSGSCRTAQAVAFVVPVPLSDTTCGPAAVLSLMVRLACNKPAALGANRTGMLQL